MADTGWDEYDYLVSTGSFGDSNDFITLGGAPPRFIRQHFEAERCPYCSRKLKVDADECPGCGAPA